MPRPALPAMSRRYAARRIAAVHRRRSSPRCPTRRAAADRYAADVDPASDAAPPRHATLAATPRRIAAAVLRR
ncbi:hypothetical protein ACQPW1_33840 [Nocardia sp. CA-128927]|uniref:hypothetical protein n=1 Tax=Nocardia sp. CA-128927 TaxID=3239975 RepID=UPI003D9642B2